MIDCPPIIFIYELEVPCNLTGEQIWVTFTNPSECNDLGGSQIPLTPICIDIDYWKKQLMICNFPYYRDNDPNPHFCTKEMSHRGRHTDNIKGISQPVHISTNIMNDGIILRQGLQRIYISSNDLSRVISELVDLQENFNS